MGEVSTHNRRSPPLSAADSVGMSVRQCPTQHPTQQLIDNHRLLVPQVKVSCLSDRVDIDGPVIRPDALLYLARTVKIMDSWPTDLIRTDVELWRNERRPIPDPSPPLSAPPAPPAPPAAPSLPVSLLPLSPPPELAVQLSSLSTVDTPAAPTANRLPILIRPTNQSSTNQIPTITIAL